MDISFDFKLKNLKLFVEAHPLTEEDMSKIRKMGAVISDDLRFTVAILSCFIVYSVEDHPQTYGKPVRFRHASIEFLDLMVDEDKADYILERLGFRARVASKSKASQVIREGNLIRAVEIYDFGS